ncbi:hypothetical protein DW806_00280 [Butyricicoccus sp. AM32-19]|nr:hypothetical protein DW806_00280 [Butyricicoccus sp. AM32-19]
MLTLLRGSAHEIIFAKQIYQNRGVYLGFDTLSGRKFPHGNFRTTVFCEVKTQIVGKTVVFRQSQDTQGASFFMSA